MIPIFASNNETNEYSDITTSNEETLVFEKINEISDLEVGANYIITSSDDKFAFDFSGKYQTNSINVNVENSQITLTKINLEFPSPVFSFSEITEKQDNSITVKNVQSGKGTNASRIKWNSSTDFDTGGDGGTAIQFTLDSEFWNVYSTGGNRYICFLDNSFYKPGNRNTSSPLNIWKQVKEASDTNYSTYYRYDAISGLDQLGENENFIITIPNMESYLSNDPEEVENSFDSFVLTYYSGSSSTESSSYPLWLAPVALPNEENEETFINNNGWTIDAAQDQTFNNLTYYPYFTATTYTGTESDPVSNESGTYYKYQMISSNSQNVYYPQNINVQPFRNLKADQNNNVRFQYIEDESGTPQIYLRGNGNGT